MPLEDSGFVTDRRAVARELSCERNAFLPNGCSLEEFREWKEHLLNNWYSRKGLRSFSVGKRRSIVCFEW